MRLFKNGSVARLQWFDLCGALNGRVQNEHSMSARREKISLMLGYIWLALKISESSKRYKNTVGVSADPAVTIMERCISLPEGCRRTWY